MEACDVLVIGGGVTGISVTLALAARGVRRTILIEPEPWARATSSQSLRIIHGGFRYLATGDLGRVWDSAQAQAEFARRFPKCVQPLPCLMPLSNQGLERPWLVRLGCRAYDLARWGARTSVPGASVLTKKKVAALQEGLLTDRPPSGALLWHDLLLTDHAEVVGSLINECRELGVTLSSGTYALGVHTDSDWCEVATNQGQIAARIVVNASGGHYGGLTFDGAPCFGGVDWVRAFNLVVGRPLTQNHALGLSSPSGRLFFLVPRRLSNGAGGTAIGTGYVSLEHAQGSSLLSEQDIEPFVVELNETLGGHDSPHSLKDEDELAVEWGLLPREPGSKVATPLSHNRIMWRSDHYVELLAAKYTTCLRWGRKVAREVDDALSGLRNRVPKH